MLSYTLGMIHASGLLVNIAKEIINSNKWNGDKDSAAMCCDPEFRYCRTVCQLVIALPNATEGKLPKCGYNSDARYQKGLAQLGRLCTWKVLGR
jgi:hypothetical protein